MYHIVTARAIQASGESWPQDKARRCIVTALTIHASVESWPQDKARRCVVTALTIHASGAGPRPAFTIYHIGFAGYYYGIY